MSSSTGVDSENPCRRLRDRSMLSYQGLSRPFAVHGWMAPSARLSPLSGMTRLGSISRLEPRPVQAGQAPYGLLKLKVRGAISPRLIPQYTQAKCSENSDSSPSTTFTRTTPAPSLRAVSTESASRAALAPFSTCSLSTTTSTVCFLFLSSCSSSDKSWISPSTRTLTNPAFCRSLNVAWCSPFRSRTRGARIIILLPSGTS